MVEPRGGTSGNDRNLLFCLPITYLSGSCFPHPALRLVKMGGGQVQMVKSPCITHLEQVQVNTEINLEGKIRGRRVKKE